MSETLLDLMQDAWQNLSDEPCGCDGSCSDEEHCSQTPQSSCELCLYREQIRLIRTAILAKLREGVGGMETFDGRIISKVKVLALIADLEKGDE